MIDIPFLEEWARNGCRCAVLWLLTKGGLTLSSYNITLNSGAHMPAPGLGVYRSSPEQTVTAVESALAQGYRALERVLADGRVRAIGVCNFSPKLNTLTIPE